MIDLARIDTAIDRQRIKNAEIQRDYDTAVSRRDHEEQIRLRRELEVGQRTLEQLRAQRRQETPVDQRAPSRDSYSSGGYFSSSNS
jgi:hypothetical protein